MLGKRKTHGSASVQHRFTLLELMMAMAISIIVGLLIYKFFANLQNAWNASMSATNEHEDARLALEFIASDLQMAMAKEDDQPERDICFHQPSSDALWFVTVAPIDSSSSCSVVEAAYRLNGNEIQRAIVDENCPEWNIYGDRDDAADQAGYITLIDGVIELTFICYDDDGSIVEPIQTNNPPAMISIELTVLDSREMKRWRQLAAEDRVTFEKQFARTFWKTVCLD